MTAVYDSSFCSSGSNVWILLDETTKRDMVARVCRELPDYPGHDRAAFAEEFRRAKASDKVIDSRRSSAQRWRYKSRIDSTTATMCPRTRTPSSRLCPAIPAPVTFALPMYADEESDVRTLRCAHGASYRSLETVKFAGSPDRAMAAFRSSSASSACVDRVGRRISRCTRRVVAAASASPMNDSPGLSMNGATRRSVAVACTTSWTSVSPVVRRSPTGSVVPPGNDATRSHGSAIVTERRPRTHASPSRHAAPIRPGSLPRRARRTPTRSGCKPARVAAPRSARAATSNASRSRAEARGSAEPSRTPPTVGCRLRPPAAGGKYGLSPPWMFAGEAVAPRASSRYGRRHRHPRPREPWPRTRLS